MAIVINAIEALNACLRLNVLTVLDIGAGDGCHSALFSKDGKQVTQVDLRDGIDYMSTDLGEYDLVWCSHVLEHQPNVNIFLKKIMSNTKEGGYICITVPPLKHGIVGGHLTLWNAGLLIYNLVIAGVDCSRARVKTYGYNISVLIKKTSIKVPSLSMDFGDIEILKEFFPLEVSNGFDGRVQDINW